MPMYEFQCAQCGHCFEEIASINAETEPCPQCNADAPRLLSAPNLKTGAAPFKVGPVHPVIKNPIKGGGCGGCSGCGSSIG